MNTVNNIDIPLPVPTAATLLSRALSTAGMIIYSILLITCILYLLWWIVVELRDYIRTRRINKYLNENKPVEYILDYPGYAIEEYCTDKNNNNDWN